MARRALTPRHGKITGLGAVRVPEFHPSAGVTTVTWDLSEGSLRPGATDASHARTGHELFGWPRIWHDDRRRSFASLIATGRDLHQPPHD